MYGETEQQAWRRTSDGEWSQPASQAGATSPKLSQPQVKAECARVAVRMSSPGQHDFFSARSMW